MGEERSGRGSRHDRLAARENKVEVKNIAIDQAGNARRVRTSA
jgi:hypothetical protein